MGDNDKRVKANAVPSVSSGTREQGADLLSTGMMEPPPSPGVLGVIGKYQIIRVIGEGGIGQVLLARDPVTNCFVAIKIIKPEYLKKDWAIHRFLTEARHMFKLAHPSIIRVLEVSDRPEGPYFVMSFMDGGSLTQKLKPGEFLPPGIILNVARHVAEALQHAHARGIIHRNLKPSNILLGDESNACLSDFGILRTILNDSVANVAQSQAEDTVSYMSPAVAAGKAEDTRCDIYSFGCLLYEMLTGQPPYQGPSVDAILKQIQAGPPQPIRQLNRNAPARLVAIAEGAMARELRDRYAAMTDVISDLDRVAQGKEPLGPHGRASSSHLGLQIFAILGMVAMLGLVAVGALHLRNRRLAAEAIASTNTTQSVNVASTPVPAVSAPVLTSIFAASPSVTQPGQPWTNSLGMKFVPVPGTKVLFSIWDTRVQDYRSFVSATSRAWDRPLFEQGPTHPAANVSWDDAKAFCEWLTEKERKEGRLGAEQSYRLPTDAEWSAAVGLEGETGGTPEEKDGKIKGVYPWGSQWPPPKRAGNYHASLVVDDFDKTSPVGSFMAIRHGLYDMSGNVWQWCEDFFDGQSGARVLRGASWNCNALGSLLSSGRGFSRSSYRCDEIGFRCVLVDASSPTSTPKSEEPKAGPSLRSSNQEVTPLELPWDDADPKKRVTGMATVTGNNANVRAAAKSTSEVLMQLNQGDQVELAEPMPAVGTTETVLFVKIQMPPAVRVWVHKNMLDAAGTTVIKTDVRARAGPGNSYTVVGRLNKGESVQPEQTLDDWVKLRPTTNCFAFVSAKFLQGCVAPTPKVAVPKVEAPKVERPQSILPTIAQIGPQSATKENPWTNSLGMKFVPVPGANVRFCVWETRVQDFEAFVNAARYDATNALVSLRGAGDKERRNTWRSPGFNQGPTHPVVGVSWEDAKAFCQWLTGKERSENRIRPGQSYRLPTDAEWSLAVGVIGESGSTPQEKGLMTQEVYPWGSQWPPPAGAGNFAGEEAKDIGLPSFEVISGYNDGYSRTSPVGSFKPNQFGLYDLSGNVYEWCEDRNNTASASRVWRGGSWFNCDLLLCSSHRNGAAPGGRYDCVGFRCVLEGGDVSAAAGTVATSASTPSQVSNVTAKPAEEKKINPPAASASVAATEPAHIVQTYPSQTFHSLMWDGKSFWAVGYYNSNAIYRLNNDFSVAQTYATPFTGYPSGIFRDGSNTWVATYWSCKKNHEGCVVRLIGFPTGKGEQHVSVPYPGPDYFCWDGASFWGIHSREGQNSIFQFNKWFTQCVPHDLDKVGIKNKITGIAYAAPCFYIAETGDQSSSVIYECDRSFRVLKRFTSDKPLYGLIWDGQFFYATSYGHEVYKLTLNRTTGQTPAAGSPPVTSPAHFTYTTNNNQITITQYIGPGGAVAIPGTINELPVTAIGESAFRNCTNVSGVAISDGITSIESCAFVNCGGLTDVTLPASVTSIGIWAFRDCRRLANVTIHASAVKFIGSGAFANCASLESVRFQGNAPTPGMGMFDYTPQATVYFRPGTTGWGKVFGGRPTAVWNAQTPANAVVSPPDTTAPRATIRIRASDLIRRNATNTTIIAGTPVATPSVLQTDVPAHFTCATYNNQITITQYTGPGGVVVMPSKVCGLPVTTIGKRAFAGCTNMTSVTIPNCVTNISGWAFHRCAKLASVEIPSSVTSIGREAFYDCTALTNVTIGRGVTSIAVKPFLRCNDRIVIKVDPANPAYWSGPDGVVFSKDKTLLVLCPTGKAGSYEIPKGVTTINEGAFQWCSNLTAVIIPTSVTTIGEQAFLGTSLTNVAIPNGVKSIEDAVFVDCTNLTSVTMPGSVTSIGHAVFGGCTKLSTVTVPGSVTSMRGNPFSGGWSGGNGLTSVSVEAANPNYSSADGVVFDKPKTRLIGYPHGKVGDYTIPGGVTRIGQTAFEGCQGLSQLVVPNSVTAVENRAFMSCPNLASIIFRGDAPRVESDSYLFWNSRRAVILYPPGTKGWGKTFAGQPALPLRGDFGCSTENDKATIVRYVGYGSDLTIPGAINGLPVTAIGRDAFFNCTNLTGVVIPDSVTSIGSRALMKCSRLARISLGNGVASLGNDAVHTCPNLTNVFIPASITRIGHWAFGDCSGLESIQVDGRNPEYSSSKDGVLFDKEKRTLVRYPQARIGGYTIPDTVTVIANAAFRSCSNLISVAIPNGLTVIEPGAFTFCGGLTHVTIPSNVTRIGEFAFVGCGGLTGIYFSGNAPACGRDVFDGADKAKVYYLPGTTGWGKEFGGRPTAMWNPQIQTKPAADEPTSRSNPHLKRWLAKHPKTDANGDGILTASELWRYLLQRGSIGTGPDEPLEFDFMSASVSQLVQCYFRMVQRSVTGKPNIPNVAAITFRTGSLQRAHGIALLECVILMSSGLLIEPEGEKFFKLSPLAQGKTEDIQVNWTILTRPPEIR